MNYLIYSSFRISFILYRFIFSVTYLLFIKIVISLILHSLIHPFTNLLNCQNKRKIQKSDELLQVSKKIILRLGNIINGDKIQNFRNSPILGKSTSIIDAIIEHGQHAIILSFINFVRYRVVEKWQQFAIVASKNIRWFSEIRHRGAVPIVQLKWKVDPKILRERGNSAKNEPQISREIIAEKLSRCRTSALNIINARTWTNERASEREVVHLRETHSLYHICFRLSTLLRTK